MVKVEKTRRRENERTRKSITDPDTLDSDKSEDAEKRRESKGARKTLVSSHIRILTPSKTLCSLCLCGELFSRFQVFTPAAFNSATISPHYGYHSCLIPLTLFSHRIFSPFPTSPAKRLSSPISCVLQLPSPSLWQTAQQLSRLS